MHEKETHRLALNADSGRALASRLRTAVSPPEQRRGLLGFRQLEPGTGLWIPTQAVHSFFMRFAIDLVYVNAEGIVLRVTENFRPWRISVCLRARAVLELPAGTIRETGTRVGHRIAFR